MSLKSDETHDNNKQRYALIEQLLSLKQRNFGKSSLLLSSEKLAKRTVCLTLSLIKSIKKNS